MEKHTLSTCKQLRDYQVLNATECYEILKKYKIVYIAHQVRCGKTATALETIRLSNFKNILFLTKKKAIQSIQEDYKDFGFDSFFNLTVTNYESLHKIKGNFDCLVLDEAHSCFLGNTLIEGVKIKDIKVGSYQKSFNFAKGIYENKKVLNVFKIPLEEDLIKIKCNGKEIVCTKSHKIFTRRGWVKAGELLPSDELQMV